MKIHELLANTKLLLQEITQGLDRQREESKREESKSTFDVKLLDLLLTVDTLSQLIESAPTEDEANAINLEPFKQFLARRWECIKNSAFSYYVTKCPAHELCISLADAMEGVLKTPKYLLLMPSITHVDNEMTATNIGDANLQLHQFILNEDNSRFIEVFPCLEAAEEDGILKHTSIFADAKESDLAPGAKKLSKTEQQWIIQHSTATSNYYNSMQELLKLKNDGVSIGAFLQRLIKHLYQGSIAGHRHAGQGGEELKAGADANEGIVEFFQFLDSLEKCQVIFSANQPIAENMQLNSYVIVNKIKNQLFRQKNKWHIIYNDPKNQQKKINISEMKELQNILQPLAKLTADKLKAEDKLKIKNIILHHHYKTQPALDGSELGNLYSRTAHGLSNNFKYFCDKLANPHLENDEEELNVSYCIYLIAGNLKQILDHNQDLFNLHPKNKAKSLVGAVESLQNKMKHVKSSLAKAMESSHYEVTLKYDRESLKRMFRYCYREAIQSNNRNIFNKIKEISGSMSERSCHEFIDENIGFTFLRDSIENIHHLKFTVQSLPETIYPELIRLFFRNNPIQLIKNCKDLVVILDIFGKQHNNLLEEIGKEKLKTLIENYKDLRLVIESVQIKNIENFLKLLEKEYVRSLIKDANHLLDLTTLFITLEQYELLDYVFDFKSLNNIYRQLNSLSKPAMQPKNDEHKSNHYELKNENDYIASLYALPNGKVLYRTAMDIIKMRHPEHEQGSKILKKSGMNLILISPDYCALNEHIVPKTSIISTDTLSVAHSIPFSAFNIMMLDSKSLAFNIAGEPSQLSIYNMSTSIVQHKLPCDLLVTLSICDHML